MKTLKGLYQEWMEFLNKPENMDEEDSASAFIEWTLKKYGKKYVRIK